MFRSLISKSILVTTFAALLPSLAACSAGPSQADEQAVSGVVSLPLIATANGHRYRLNNAYVYITGPQYAQLVSSGEASEATLSTTLQTGSYVAYLYNWSLELDDGSGTFSPIQATLVSGSAVSFSIYNGATSTISYRFATDGVSVTVGSGALNVAVAVDEGAAVCSPFSDDCGPGAWCPPTGLTGAPRACIAAGSTAIGEPCAAPSECVANASCFDLGSGPVCTELCALPAGELSCASGGSCTQLGSDYGQCTPAAPDQP
ncbi:MAG TPA: hypothetical protein VGC79_14925 [Polyangiaceae bacterium]